MDTLTKSINSIQPSQLYISSKKLRKVKEYLDSVTVEEMEPLPIKRIGEDIFFTDGHTRAFVLHKKGYKKIKVYWDNDDLNWLQYMVCIDWCNKNGITSIKDLENKIINHKEYKELWVQKCEEMHNDLKKNINTYINITEIFNQEIKSSISELVLRNLPEWFGIEESIQKYMDQVKNKCFFAVKIGDKPIGFISIKDHNKYTSEIYVLGLLKEFHGKGIGKKLLNKVVRKLEQQKSKKFLTVKTLSDLHPDKYYKKTRKFYNEMDFYPLEEIKELWGEGNPCLYMIKIL